MKELVRDLRREAMTARAFAYTVRHSSLFKRPSKDFWDNGSSQKLSSIVDNLSDPNDEERIEIKRILGDIGVGSVLDVGCGPSTEYLSYKNNGSLKDVSYVGVDISQKMIDISRKRFPGIDIVRGDGENLPFADFSFDAVVLKHVLEHQPDGYKKSVAEAIRVARKCVVIDFFLPPLTLPFDVNLTDANGVSANWYSESRFREFAFTLPISYLEKSRARNKYGQWASVYTLRK